MRSRLTLRTSHAALGSVRSTSFCVDRGVIAALRPGDRLYMAYTPCGGLALSAVREGGLVVAIGAVTSVPLGDNVHARRALDLLSEAEAILRRCDSSFEFREVPIELTIGDATLLLPGGSAQAQDYEVWIQHGFLRGTPGVDECVAVSRKGLCSDVAARLSAVLLRVDGIERARR